MSGSADVAPRMVREDALGRLFLGTEQAQAAFERIDDLLVRGWEASYCRALLLLGPSRAGKTHIVRNWLRQRTSRDAAGTERPLVVMVEVPAGCTLKTFATDLLMALRDPAPEHGSQTAKTRRVVEACEAQRVDLIVIDEVQRLIDADTDKVKRDVANWLTALLNKAVCPLLLVGEPTASRVFHGNTHLQGRTLGSMMLRPYDWADDCQRVEWQVFLNQLDEFLGLPRPSRLGNLDTALRIHAFARGLLGEAARLVDQARSVVRRRGWATITVEALALAADELAVTEDPDRVNPFRVRDTEVLLSPSPVERLPPRTRIGGRTRVRLPLVGGSA